MFAFFAIVGALMSFVGGMKQSRALDKAAAQQRSAAEAGKKAADRNAARIEAETAEKARRERLAAEERQGLTKARQAASGGAASGSNTIYLDTMERVDDENISWLRKAGQSQAEIARLEGEAGYQSGMASATGTKAQASNAKFEAFGSLVGAGESIYKLWG